MPLAQAVKSDLGTCVATRMRWDAGLPLHFDRGADLRVNRRLRSKSMPSRSVFCASCMRAALACQLRDRRPAPMSAAMKSGPAAGPAPPPAERVR